MDLPVVLGLQAHLAFLEEPALPPGLHLQLGDFLVTPDRLDALEMLADPALLV